MGCIQKLSSSSRKLVNVFNTIIKYAWKTQTLCRQEGRPTSLRLQKGKQTRLRQLPCSIVSFHTKEYCSSGKFPTSDIMWVLHKPRNHRHNLLSINTEKIHCTEHTPLHICRLPKIFWHSYQRSAIENPIEIRVPWRLHQAPICLAY